MMTQKLVVVGNGMAGVRAIEEVLMRGGAENFDITVFGDEPYGNYNRILLSNVLAGSDNAEEIYLNGLDWYADNGIVLRAGVRVIRIDSCPWMCPMSCRSAMPSWKNASTTRGSWRFMSIISRLATSWLRALS